MKGLKSFRQGRSPQCDRLIIFGRYPVPGRTKTRLIPALGPVGAADLQRRLTERTLKRVRAFASRRSVELELCFEGGSEHKIRRWLGPVEVYSQQGPGDLGMRIHSAFLRAFQSGCRNVILIGTDIPGLEPGLLEQAFDSLASHELVLGPTHDGGYWLIGLNRPADLFHGINWGTGIVFDQTATLAKGHGLAFHRLETLSDIDTIDDLKQWRPDWAGGGPYISVIIPALNERVNIEAAIRGAEDRETEIIVVDGGSTDDTVVRARDAGARVEESPRGRALQQNRGAAVARGKVLLFLHADTHLPDGYPAHVFETLMDPGTAAGAFRFKTDLNKPFMKVIEFMTNMRSRYFKLPYGDQGLFMRRSIFESVGRFPEVSVAEDLLLVRRLSKRGIIRISPAEVITSARRWLTFGMLRTTLINQVIVSCCCLGVSPHALASLYQTPRAK